MNCKFCVMTDLSHTKLINEHGQLKSVDRVDLEAGYFHIEATTDSGTKIYFTTNLDYRYCPKGIGWENHPEPTEVSVNRPKHPAFSYRPSECDWLEETCGKITDVCVKDYWKYGAQLSVSVEKIADPITVPVGGSDSEIYQVDTFQRSWGHLFECMDAEDVAWVYEKLLSK